MEIWGKGLFGHSVSLHPPNLFLSSIKPRTVSFIKLFIGGQVQSIPCWFYGFASILQTVRRWFNERSTIIIDTTNYLQKDLVDGLAL